MRNEAVIGIVVLFVVAGCVQASGDEDATSSTEPAGPIGPADVDPNSEFGVLQGTVVDEENAPIVGALVAIEGAQVQTSTNDLGVFAFRDLAPGRYTVLVGALGFESAGRVVDVTAGQLTSAAFVLRAIDIEDEVFYEVLHFTGFYDCALASPVWISSCSYPYTNAVGTLQNGTCEPYFTHICTPAPGVNVSNYGAPRDVQNNLFRHNITIRQNVGQLHAEVMWTPSSAAATRMNILIVCGDYDPVWDDCMIGLRYGPGSGVNGPSPIKSVIERENWEDEEGNEYNGFYTPEANGTKWDLNLHDEIWVMNYVGLPFGDPQIAFQQKFELYDTVFYNGNGPDDWTVLADA